MNAEPHLTGQMASVEEWMINNTPAPIQLKRQQGGGGVMFWAGIHCNNLIGHFRVNDGVKMNSDNYQSLLTRHFLPYYRHLRGAIENLVDYRTSKNR